ncbi:MAG TPA: Ig-like domain-containing protein [Candidatus Limnocylindria bacterium]|nr:Ig-like domain-containing protein [Candidatus Limnocylindria bacterium]
MKTFLQALCVVGLMFLGNVGRTVAQSTDPAGQLTTATLTIKAPTPDQQFAHGSVITIGVTAVDPDGEIRRVEFYAGDKWLGISEILTKDVIVPGRPRELHFAWTNAPTGEFKLHAKATSTAGLAINSAAIPIKVLGDSSKPSLTITSPKDGETVRAGETNKVVAVGTGRVGGITDVELLMDGQKVAESHLTFFRPPGADEPVTHEFAIVIPAGDHQLVARDLSDPAFSSPTVKITALTGATSVTIVTHKSPAFESGELADRTGSFTVSRSGDDLGWPLTVFYTLGGTATQGQDYRLVEVTAGGPNPSTLHSVTIGVGFATAEIAFITAMDQVVEGTESVVATLVESPLAGPLPSYEIGEPHEAKAEIGDSTNPVRLVMFTAPTNGAVFTSPATIRVEASAEITGVGITGLLFTANGIEIGHALYCCETCFCAEPTPGQPFSGGIEWKDVKPGTYTLVAQALTFLDSIPESDPVTITVLGPPPTPQLTITQPTNGASLRADESTKVVAVGIGRVGGITDVELLLDGQKAAESHLTFFRPPGADEPVTHEFNVRLPAGDHELVARDLTDAQVVSPAVHVHVTDPNPPATLTWVQPKDGAKFPPGTPIDLEVAAFDPKGLIFHADFFDDGKRIGGADYSCPLCKPAPGVTLSIPFQWTGAPVGKHLLSAVATNSAGIAVGTPRIAIEVTAPTGPRIVATRKLPTVFQPGVKFTVSITVQPGDGVQDYVVEDHPPFLFGGGAVPPPDQPLWNVTAISDGGVFDFSTGAVKFGPFFDHQARTLTYEITPNAASIEVAEFAGSAVADGTEVPIGGDRLLLGNTRHPADRDPADDRISATELTAYGAAWKAGKEWPAGPNPIPMDYVTRAGALWREGEQYRFDPSAGPAPLCWVSNPFLPPITSGDSGATGSNVSARPAFHGIALRRIEGQAGKSLTVTVRVLSAPGVNSSALEERVAGTPSVVSEAGPSWRPRRPSAGVRLWMVSRIP